MKPAAKPSDLLKVTASWPDRKVAMLVAEVALSFAPERCSFRIDHDTRPPANKACPLRYDWALKAHVGIQDKPRHIAYGWLTRALLHGYQIEQVDARHQPTTSPAYSIAIIRRRADNARRAPVETDDDDIPF